MFSTGTKLKKINFVNFVILLEYIKAMVPHEKILNAPNEPLGKK